MSPAAHAAALIDIANKNGGKDNITVALAYVFEDKTFSKKIKNLFGWHN